MGEARRRRQLAEAAGLPWPPQDVPAEPPARCAGCAFTPGTEANRQPLTLRKAEICARAAHPFFCHENIDADGQLPADRRLCTGYVDAMGALQAKGHFDRQTPAERLQLLQDLETVQVLEEAMLAEVISQEEAAVFCREWPTRAAVAAALKAAIRRPGHLGVAPLAMLLDERGVPMKLGGA